jgi:hypothetical protein
MEMVDFNPQKIRLLIGFKLIEGLASEALTLRPLSPRYRTVVGVNGKVTTIMSMDNRAELTLALVRQAKDNAYLSKLAKADQFSGRVLFPVTINDEYGDDMYSAPSARIIEEPFVDYKKTAQSAIWKIELYYLTRFDGGS